MVSSLRLHRLAPSLRRQRFFPSPRRQRFFPSLRRQRFFPSLRFGGRAGWGASWLGSEERLAATEGPGVYISQTQASTSDKLGLLDARLLTPDSIVNPLTILRLTRASGSAIQNAFGSSVSDGKDDQPSASKEKKSFLSEAHRVSDALCWVKRGMDVSAFAGAAGLLVGPGASNPFSGWLSSFHGLDHNWNLRPGVYDAVRRFVQEQYGNLSPEQREEKINELMNPRVVDDNPNGNPRVGSFAGDDPTNKLFDQQQASGKPLAVGNILGLNAAERAEFVGGLGKGLKYGLFVPLAMTGLGGLAFGGGAAIINAVFEIGVTRFAGRIALNVGLNTAMESLATGKDPLTVLRETWKSGTKSSLMLLSGFIPGGAQLLGFAAGVTGFFGARALGASREDAALIMYGLDFTVTGGATALSGISRVSKAANAEAKLGGAASKAGSEAKAGSTAARGGATEGKAGNASGRSGKATGDTPTAPNNPQKTRQPSPTEDAANGKPANSTRTPSHNETQNQPPPCSAEGGCFTEDLPLFVDHNRSKPIGEIKSYEEHGDDCDWIITRSELDPNGPLVKCRVLKKFVRTAPILNVHVGGRVIGTTVEHPFYIEGKEWYPAFGLDIGDVTHDFGGPNKPIEGVASSGQIAKVVNISVENCRTYFVGAPDWGFAVWAHNQYNYTRNDYNRFHDWAA